MMKKNLLLQFVHGAPTKALQKYDIKNRKQAFLKKIK